MVFVGFRARVSGWGRDNYQCFSLDISQGPFDVQLWEKLTLDNSRFEAALPTHSDAGFGVNLFFIGLASGPHVGSRDAGPCRSVWAKVLALY